MYITFIYISHLVREKASSLRASVGTAGQADIYLSIYISIYLYYIYITYIYISHLVRK